MITEFGCFSFLVYPFLICTFFIDMKLIPCDATVSFDVFFFLFISPFHNDALLMLDHLFEWDNSLFTMPYNKVLIKSGTKLVQTTILGYLWICYFLLYVMFLVHSSCQLNNSHGINTNSDILLVKFVPSFCYYDFIILIYIFFSGNCVII